MKRYLKDIAEIICILVIIFFIVVMCSCNNVSYKVPNKDEATLLYQGNKYDIVKIDDMLVFVPAAISEGESREIKICKMKEDAMLDVPTIETIDSINMEDDTINISNDNE